MNKKLTLFAIITLFTLVSSEAFAQLGAYFGGYFNVGLITADGYFTPPGYGGGIEARGEYNAFSFGLDFNYMPYGEGEYGTTTATSGIKYKLDFTISK